MNGGDYADYLNTPATDCQYIQNAEGCLGSKIDIATDGGSEVRILDAVGYNLNPTVGSPTPEPSSLALLGSGMLGLVGIVRRRRSSAV